MGERIKKAIKEKPVPWVMTPWRQDRCGDCGGPQHAPWWKSTAPPSCKERQQRG